MERSTMLWLNPLFQWPWLQCRKLDLRLRRHLDEVKVPDIGESQVGPALAMGKSQVPMGEIELLLGQVVMKCVQIRGILDVCWCIYDYVYMYVYIYNYYICMIVWMLAYLVYKKKYLQCIGPWGWFSDPKDLLTGICSRPKDSCVVIFNVLDIYIYMNEWPI